MMLRRGILLLVLSVHISLTHQSGLKEYCQEETFIATCTENEVVVMETALYGRMRAGGCISGDMGHLNCYANVLSLFDKRCSGKQQCSLQVLNGNIDVEVSCHPQLFRYLQASYTCLPVFQVQPHFCHIQLGNPDATVLVTPETVSNLQGTIVPTDVIQRGCGGMDQSRLVLEALPGQQFDVEMIDFYWSNSTASDCSIKYGLVTDMQSGQSAELCGGKRRRVDVMQTLGHKLQLQFNRRSSAKFIIKYKVRNCPRALNMPNGWFESDGSLGRAGCHDNDKVWHLSCDGNTWSGLTGDCKVKKGGIASIAGINISHEHIIMVASGVFLFISGVITIVACCYFRSYCKRKKTPALPPELYQPRDFQFMRPDEGSSSGSRRESRKHKDKTQQETSFSRHPTDTRYKSLHPNGMQGRPLPEIPEYDVPKGTLQRDEQETLLVRGKANDEHLPNDVILPSNISLPSDRSLNSMNSEEEQRRMVSMIRGHPNNMTLFSASPHSRKPKNPRLYAASTMGRVLQEHPNMMVQSQFVPVVQSNHASPQVFTKLPHNATQLSSIPDVVCVQRKSTENTQRTESPVQVHNEKVQVHSAANEQPEVKPPVEPSEGQTVLPPVGEDVLDELPSSSILRSFMHQNPKHNASRPLSV